MAETPKTPEAPPEAKAEETPEGEQPDCSPPPEGELPDSSPAAPEGELSESSPPPEVETAPDPEPGSPRRKRPREPAPSLVVPRLDASFWHQLVTESRATREAARRERYANLMRF